MSAMFEFRHLCSEYTELDAPSSFGLDKLLFTARPCYSGYYRILKLNVDMLILLHKPTLRNRYTVDTVGFKVSIC